MSYPGRPIPEVPFAVLLLPRDRRLAGVLAIGKRGEELDRFDLAFHQQIWHAARPTMGDAIPCYELVLASAACQAGGSEVPTAKRGTATIVIAAPPQDVYRLISDITRMGEWSPECYRCTWLGEASGAVPGARFRGHNRLGRYRWQTTAVVTAAEPGRLLAFTTVHDKTGRDETAWRYDLQPVPGGTLLTESYQFLWCPVVNRLAELPIPRTRQVRRGILQTLSNIKAAAEAAAASAPPTAGDLAGAAA